MPRTPRAEPGPLPDLSGTAVGRYLVEDRLGSGPGGAVYRATERGERRHVALKVLDPVRSGHPGFVARLVEDTTRIAALGHPRVNPVYDVGTQGGLTYVGMRLVRGGTLQDHLRLRRLDQDSALRILHEVAGAVESAHEVGIVHGDLKASNVLLDTDGSACVTDFGLGPPRSGSQADVRALESLLDQMTEGGAAVTTGGTGARPGSVRDLLEGLDLSSWALPSPDVADDQLRALLDASFDAAFAVDRDGTILHWNGRAARLLMRPARTMVGQPLLRSLIAPRHRELLERVLLTAAAPSAGGDGHPVEVLAVRGDGAERTLEASVSPLRFGRGVGGAVLFCRDVTRAPASVPRVPAEPLREALGRECGRLGLAAAAVWVLTPDRLSARCEAFWHRAPVETAELEMLSQGVQRLSHLGAVRASVSSGTRSWTHLESSEHEGRRAGAARRTGLVATGTVPLLDGAGSTLGALEVFTSLEPGPSAAQLDVVARAIAPLLRPRAPEHEAATQRFVLDPSSSVLGFSCAFMKLLTVHGRFGDFTGWMEIQDEDPATIRSRCVIKAASVETGSLDRNFHLRSADFFNVERFPDLVFDVTRVGPLGDQRFRVLGELRIRDVVRPVRLDARLEDTEMEGDRVTRMTLTGTAVINRQDWFLDWERALQAGRWIVGDWVRLDLVLTLVRGGEEGAGATPAGVWQGA